MAKVRWDIFSILFILFLAFFLFLWQKGPSISGAVVSDLDNELEGNADSWTDDSNNTLQKNETVKPISQEDIDKDIKKSEHLDDGSQDNFPRSLGGGGGGGSSESLTEESCTAESKETTCSGIFCGAKSNNCGGTVVCGECDPDLSCTGGYCVNSSSNCTDLAGIDYYEKDYAYLNPEGAFWDHCLDDSLIEHICLWDDDAGSFSISNITYDCGFGCDDGECIIKSCDSDEDCTDIWRCSYGVCNSSNQCELHYNSSYDICRDAKDGCDIAEYCTGNSSDCPEDTFKEDGALCSDGVFCNGEETCLSGICTSGIDVDCSSNNTFVSSCENIPDNNPLTYDSYSFISYCNESIDACTNAPSAWQSQIDHTCNISCGAGCTLDVDCLCPEDMCIGEDFYDYPQNGECLNCSCSECEPEISVSDSLCSSGIIHISSCGKLGEQGRMYALDAPIINDSLSFACLNITRPDIILDCNGNGVISMSNVAGIYSDQDNITIQNCNMSMGTSSGGYGIELDGSEGSSVRNNILGPQYTGLYVHSSSSSITVANNSFEYNSHKGIHISYSTDITIENNSITDVAYYGIMFSQSSSNIIRKNTLSDNIWYGIIIEDSPSGNDGDNTIEDNIINSSRMNLYVKSSDNAIVNNTISGSTLYHGIYVYGGDNNTIRGNNVTSSSQAGIRIKDSDGNALSDNVVYLNQGIGMEFSGVSAGNVLEDNIFCQNDQDVSCANDQSFGATNYCGTSIICGGTCLSCSGSHITGSAIKEITREESISYWKIFVDIFFSYISIIIPWLSI